MKKLMRYINLYFKYISMAIKSKLAYRMDVFIGIFGFVLTNAISFSTLYLTIASIGVIDGFTLENMAFLYGLYLIPKAIDHILSDNLWTLGGSLVRLGQLDKYLIKPVNPLFQLISESFQYEGFGELILGIVFVAMFGPKQGITFAGLDILALVICEIGVCLLFFSIKLIFASLAFWMKRSMQLMSPVYNMNDYARYPITIFKNKVIEAILLYILPYSLFMFCPVACLISPTHTINYVFGIEMNIWTLTLVLIAYLVVFMSLGFILWKRGLKRYESAGS